MPFELGIDFGCRTYGRPRQRCKRTLVLEAKPHRYKASISDLAGADMKQGFSPQDIEMLPVGELVERMTAWVASKAAIA